MRRLTFTETEIPGCVEILAQRADDLRGSFVKTFHEEVYRAAGLPGHFAEWYHAYSHEGVLRTTTVFAPDCDAGVAWDSAGVDWVRDAPILSDRDRDLPALADFASPFVFEATP